MMPMTSTCRIERTVKQVEVDQVIAEFVVYSPLDRFGQPWKACEAFAAPSIGADISIARVTMIPEHADAMVQALQMAISWIAEEKQRHGKS